MAREPRSPWQLGLVALVAWLTVGAVVWGLNVGTWRFLSSWAIAPEIGFATIVATTFLGGLLAFWMAGWLGRFVGRRGGGGWLAAWPLLLLAVADSVRALTASGDTPLLARLTGPTIWIALAYASWFLTERARREG